MKTRLSKIYNFVFFLTSLLFPSAIFAQRAPDAVVESQYETFSAQDAVGSIEVTPGIERFDTQAGGIGLMLFVSTLIRFATIIAGIWVLFNFILAGYTYLTSSGDAGAHGKVQNKITMSVLGLILIVATYTLIGIIGFIFFGDAGYILNPEISGPTG